MNRAEKALQDALGYEFSDPELLRTALTHSSALSEGMGYANYERLEFLGDAVLELVISHHLFDTYPELTEGEMTKTRASVVSESSLAEFAEELGLSEALVLGKGEIDSGGREKASILSDAFEALLGAVYLDGGFDGARAVIVSHLAPLVAERVRIPGGKDFKTRLHELLAARGTAPLYVFAESGPDHAKLFRVEVIVDGGPVAWGSGTSKKRAQQEAARRALRLLDA